MRAIAVPSVEGPEADSPPPLWLFKDENRKFVRGCFRLAEEGHILLSKRQIRHHKVI